MGCVTINGIVLLYPTKINFAKMSKGKNE